MWVAAQDAPEGTAPTDVETAQEEPTISPESRAADGDSPENVGEQSVFAPELHLYNASQWLVQNRLGIGTQDPRANLHIEGGSLWRGEWRRGMRMAVTSAIEFRTPTDKSFGIGSDSGGKLVFFAANSSGATPSTGTMYMDVDGNFFVEGETTTKVLRITGGGDIAEPFDVIESDTVEPGMVVAIDPANPGKLRIADKAYDRMVAGIVSGAGGINPGLVLQQEGSVAMGEHPVALTGRVYVMADASNGEIQPGDLLTTSELPGHAMKVTDYELAQGAVLGKAMTPLEEGTGLVLVLVTLQ
jgi:hypothetical protein